MAKRPPSSGTSGRSSGGSTGITSRIIHSGRFPERRKDSTSLRRLAAFWRRMIEVSVRMIMRSSAAISSRSSRSRRSRIASAPIAATKALAELLARLAVLLLGEDLLLLDRGVAGVDDHVGLEVEHPLELAHRHVEQQADPGGQALEEPDVGHRGRKLDVAHPLTPDLGLGDLDAALVADDAAVLHPLVLAAQALPVGDRAEDLGAEQAVPLRLERAVVDGLRLGDLAVRPGPDLLRAGETQADGVEVVEGLRLLEEAADLAQGERSMIATPYSSSCCRSSTSSASACSSRTSTLNDSGRPGSSGTWPLTIAS